MLTKSPASIQSHTSARSTNDSTAMGGVVANEEQNDPASGLSMGVIEALGALLLSKRDEALQWRTQSGIENDWQEDEDFYNAVDVANPEGESHVGKPINPEGGAVNEAVRASGKSSVFIPITRAYVDGASARVADMLLPSDEPPWQIKPTPVNDMQQAAAEAGNPQTAVAAAAAGAAGTGPMPAMPGGMPATDPAAMQPGQAQPPAPAGVADILPDDEKAAERANKIIEDWLVECQWHAEVRKAIEDAARIGTGVIKGPFPMVKTSRAYKRDPETGNYSMVKTITVVPVTKRVKPQNFWTDPAGGENHQVGSYTWELDDISSRTLRNLLNDEDYIRENILRALREGPGKQSGKDRGDNTAFQIDIGATFPIWYFTGEIDKGTMIAAGVPEDMLPPGEDMEVAIPAVVEMVNDYVIKVSPMALDAGGLPYDVFTWQRRQGLPWGKGVARQIRTPQRMLNAGVRAMMDNGALSSGPQWAIRQGWVVAIDGNSSVITPRKGWYITQNAPPQTKLEDCISFTNIQAATAELQQVIDLALRFAEDATGLPMLMQGQQGEATTTATGMTILNNNGSTVLRRIARTFDDQITEPHIRRYYFWLLADPNTDPSAKGDMQVDARGSTYLVDRELQAQNLNQLYPMFAQHPDVHPGRLAEEVAKANRLSYQRIMLTDAEKAERDKQPPPVDPAIEIAKLRAQSAEKIEAARLQQKAQEHGDNIRVAEGDLQAKFELGMGDLAAKLNISEDQIKSMLAVAVMQRTGNQQDSREQRQHERTSAIEDSDRNPPAEPVGRAPAGQAWQA